MCSLSSCSPLLQALQVDSRGLQCGAPCSRGANLTGLLGRAWQLIWESCALCNWEGGLDREGGLARAECPFRDATLVFKRSEPAPCWVLKVGWRQGAWIRGLVRRDIHTTIRDMPSVFKWACPMLKVWGRGRSLDRVCVLRGGTLSHQRHAFRDYRPLSGSSTWEKASQAY